MWMTKEYEMLDWNVLCDQAEVAKTVNISSLLCHNKTLGSTFQGMAS